MGIIVGIISGIAFYIGLTLDASPSIWKILIEGIIYYIPIQFIKYY